MPGNGVLGGGAMVGSDPSWTRFASAEGHCQTFSWVFTTTWFGWSNQETSREYWAASADCSRYASRCDPSAWCFSPAY